MEKLILPRLSGQRPGVPVPKTRQVTLIGASGAGKTRFMEELMRLNGGSAYCLSAVGAPFPEREESRRPGSIDALFRQAAGKAAYMRTDAVSELDKLAYMLFTDEFEALLRMKQRAAEGRPEWHPTRLDVLARIWEKVFPGNRIVRTAGSLMFETSSGGDLIGVSSLSQGEQTALYYIAGVLYAMHGAVIFIDSPSLFLHPSVLTALWDSIEELRPDCTFVYNSVDVGFVNSRSHNTCIWVKSYDAAQRSWDYETVAPDNMTSDIFVDLVGTRKPVLFIEGDAVHSIDARLYPQVFPEWTVRPLGSCDKVIETVRTFNDLRHMHHLESRGIVDRDRRTDPEVDYLRRKNIMVPEVAEVENLFLLEEVVKALARRRRRDAARVFAAVRARVMKEFGRLYSEQALQHVRHRVKRAVECKVDARFNCITAMETHLHGLADLLRPRERYDALRREFQQLIDNGDYNGVLKVFNHKPMLGDCGVAQALGLKNKEEYVGAVIQLLRGDSPEAESARGAIKRSFTAAGGTDKQPRIPLAPALPEPSGQTKPTARKKPGEKHNKRGNGNVKKM